MTHNLLFNTIIPIAIFLIASCSTNHEGQLTITNPAEIERTDELIVVKRSVIGEKVGKIPLGKYVVLTTSDKKPVVLQYDDLDNDGNWDEAAFLYSFKPKEEIKFSIAVANEPAAIKAVVKAHARHKRKNADNSFGDDLVKDSIPPGQAATDFTKQPLPPFLTEGPAWENDKVGFRLYFDVRNGKDIWGKTTTRMVLDEAGLDTADNYHKQAEWGMDILKVGKSLGAGSLALSIKLSNGIDTLVRLGGMNMGKVIYEKIADGPVRAIFRLHYPAWKVLDNSSPVSLTEEISIAGGQYFYESKVMLTGAPINSELVTGIVNLHSKQSNQLDTADCKILYTYDTQTENNDKLGMGIIIKNEFFHSFGTTDNEGTDIQNTYTIAASIDKDKPVTFRFYAGWEKSNDQFKSETTFREFLGKQAVFIKYRVTIK